jgi:hypothetical protein
MTEQILQPSSLESNDGGTIDIDCPKPDRSLAGEPRPGASRSNDGGTTDTNTTKTDRGLGEE